MNGGGLKIVLFAEFGGVIADKILCILVMQANFVSVANTHGINTSQFSARTGKQQ